MKSLETHLRALTFVDLKRWAGESVFQQGREYLDRVFDLGVTDDGCLAAWVTGRARYATAVQVDSRGCFDWHCTCPYRKGPCKHAVALLLAAADRVKWGRTVAELDEQSELHWALTAELGKTGDDSRIPQSRSWNKTPMGSTG